VQRHDLPAGSESVQTVGLLVVPNFSMIAFAAAIEPLRLANRVAGKTFYAWRVFSEDGQAVTASNGMSMEVDGSFAEVEALPAVIVCSGVDVHKLDHRNLIRCLRRLALWGVSIGAVCTGTYVLAQARLLEGFRCTIHWENFESFREEFPQLDVSQELFEIDRTRFTCAGGTAAADMILSMIAKQKGPEIANLVTDQLIHHRIRDAHERQRMELGPRLGVSHPKLLAVIAEMENAIETPRSTTELARKVKLSTRQLHRLFRSYVGESPRRYYLGLRLERARYLLLQTAMPIFDVALACGFVTASHFSRSYSQHFGCTPSQDRRPQRQHTVQPGAR
jgi:transcriptional regulator GlxA family with amidase domain